MDMLQLLRCRGWESSQEGVAVVQVGDDQHLDQELHCVLCGERPGPADVVEGKSAGSGHSRDFRAQDSLSSRITPSFLAGDGNTVTSSTVTGPREGRLSPDEEALSFTKV